MTDPQPPPPPVPRTELLMKRCKVLWRLLLISNFALGAYLFARAKKKDLMEIHGRTTQKLQKEKAPVEILPEHEPEPDPESITSSLDSIYEDESLFVPVTSPVEVRGPIPVEQQREIFEWMLEEKRKLKPKDPIEKKQINEEKAILKQFLRAKTIPKL